VTAPIFISYSSIDQKIAETICDALQSRGDPCWIACRDVGPGENFQEAIVKAIRSAKLMILVFTSNANNSDEIKKEVVLAGRHRVTVVPVRVEDVLPNDALAYEFATRQWIDLFKDWEREIERLAAQIGNILGERGNMPAANAAVPRSHRPSPLRMLAWSFPVVLLAAGGLAYWWLVAAPQSARDERAWSDAASVGTIQALRQYMDTFPGGVHVAEAQQRIRSADDKAWTDATGAGTMVGLNRYLAQFPDGAHVAQAQRTFATMERQVLEQNPGADKTRFDGAWRTTIVCPSTRGAQGFTYQFPAQVKDGFFHGERGTEGRPTWLSIDGKIQLDGSAELFAQGLTGDAAFAFNAPPGTSFSYHILARFEGSSATGMRVELRPCDFNSVRR
jgi:TIR domain